jgi:hypothetical protein
MKENRGILLAVLLIPVMCLFGWISLNKFVEECGLLCSGEWALLMLVFIFTMLFLVGLLYDKNKYVCPSCNRETTYNQMYSNYMDEDCPYAYCNNCIEKLKEEDECS